MQLEAEQNESLLLRVPVAAQMIGVCRSTLYELIKQGEIGHVLVGTSIRIPTGELQAWIKRQPVIYGKQKAA